MLHAGEVLLIDLNPTESSSPDSNPVPPPETLIFFFFFLMTLGTGPK